MPSPNRLTRKLNEILGPEAGDAMADWMNRADENASDFRSEMFGFRQEVRADFAELRQEMHAEFARVRQEMNDGLASVRRDMTDGLASVRQDMNAALASVRKDLSDGLTTAHRETAEVRVGLANLEKASAQRHAEFLRWMIGFWLLSLVTLIGSIIALARILAP